ncbi:hypothetical protein HPB48_012410 [Haemaphysalis longicornis]|uniref:Uncharacterized protein n=1 Tax=Haemaphysalis longicornis TaxID=44386 RepID=A0A9J6G0I7_HAELO|nr:hypothetical protein HPB48_012410 [Haemaphysalis longicornis]
MAAPWCRHGQAEPALPKMVQPVAAAVAPPPATAARDATARLHAGDPGPPVGARHVHAQPSAAVTVFQQQHPLTAVTPTATGVATGAGGVVSQPILVFNDQGVPVLQNVVTFQNTSIILNPQGHTVGARAPGSMVSFAGPDMLPQMHLAGQSPDDFAHSAALGASLVHCDPKLKEAKLCGVQHNTAFLSSTGMVMNQPLLSLGAGATMIAGQTAPAPQVPSAFLLPSGQIIPVVSQPQVVSAPVAPAQPLGGQVAANVPTSSCAASYGKVVHCEPTQSYMCREHAAAMQSKAPATPASSSSGVAAATAGAQHGACKKQHHLCPQHSSPSSSKCVAVPDSSRAKPACSHTASKQQLCSIRPKPTSQTPDSSQAKPSCARKGGGKKVATRPSLETPAKKARTEGPRADDESATTQAPSSSSTTTAAVAQSTEGVSSTSNKELPPLAADILAQATESIFACGSVEATASQAVQSRGKSPASLNDRPPLAAAAATTAEAATLQATTVTTVASPPSASVALTQSQCSKTSTVAEAVCSSDNLPANSGIEEASSIKNELSEWKACSNGCRNDFHEPAVGRERSRVRSGS